MSVNEKTFHWADYLVFAAMLILSTSIGVFYAVKDRKKKSAGAFLSAGRYMNLVPVTLSLAASFISAVALLGVPAEIYQSGTMFVWNGLAMFLAVFGATQIYIPIFYKLNLPSVYEYINLRFDRRVRLAGSVVYIINMISYMAVVVYAPSLAFNAVTGFSLWGSIVAAIGVCTIYTALGGMKAVLWTNSLQIVIMLAGLLATLIKGAEMLGGFGNAWNIAESGGRMRFIDYSFDPRTRHSIWSMAIGSAFPWLGIYGTNQAQVQRAMSCRTMKQMKISIWLALVNMWVIIYLCCMIGIVMYSYYAECDPLVDGRVMSRDQLLPLMVMDVLGEYPGVPGLFLASVFSASISTVSSGLNALATIVLEDFLKTSCLKNISEKQEVWLSKGLIVIFGVVSLGLCWVVSQLGPLLTMAYSVFGLIGGPQFGLFTLGILFPWSNKWGAFSGFISSLALVFWIAIGKFIYKPAIIPADPPLSCLRKNITGVSLTTLLNSTDAQSGAPELNLLIDLYQVSYMWYGPIGVTSCVVVGLIVSFLTGYTRPSTVDPRLICPLFDVLCPCLPNRLRRFLWFGVRHDEVNTCDAYVKESDITKESDTERTIATDVDYEDVTKMSTGHIHLSFVSVPQENSVENTDVIHRKNTISSVNMNNLTPITKL